MRKIYIENVSKKIITYSLFSGILVCCFDAVLQIILDPQTTFIESILNPSAHVLRTRLLLWITLSLFFVILSQKKTIQDLHDQVENIFNNISPICITNLNYEIITANDAYWSTWGRREKSPLKCYEHRPGISCHTKDCAIAQVLNGAKSFTCESHKNTHSEKKTFLVTVTPYLDSTKNIAAIIESFEDITERKKLENEKEILISNLQKALDKVQLISGLLPICASCKGIKDDKGRWHDIETYIANHSEATCTHGICPECAERLYPAFYPSIKEEILQHQPHNDDQ